MFDLLLLLLRPVFLNEDTEFLLDSFDVRLCSDPNVSLLRLGTALSLATKILKSSTRTFWQSQKGYMLR